MRRAKTKGVLIGGVIGGFILVWRLVVAVLYVPLTMYRLIAG